MFRVLFSIVGNMNEYQVAAIFERLPNNHRIDAIRQMLRESTLPDVLKDRVLYFCRCFDICADNRHAIMHSHSGGIFTSYSRNARGIRLSKYSKSGIRLVCAASLADLRSVADDINCIANFGGNICSNIRIFLICRDRDDEAAFWRIPLRDKPPLPTKLNWVPEADLVRPPQPESSQE